VFVFECLLCVFECVVCVFLSGFGVRFKPGTALTALP
jgi:hypothetical protein